MQRLASGVLQPLAGQPAGTHATMADVAKPRITGGRAKGRELETPKRGTRPSPARLRAALFDALQSREGERFLDLYAGSGAVGLEAASRDFSATCVENDAAAFAVLRGNARRIGGDPVVVRADALAWLERQARGSFDVVFVDPPFDLDLASIFVRVVTSGVLASGGRYLFQHPSNDDPRPRVEAALRDLGVTPTRVETRRYGSNHVLVIDVP